MYIVTFNLRCDNDYDGENRFQFRKGLILDRIAAEKPDVIGFQECLPVMSDFLRTYMLGYTCVGCGRDADYGGENNMIAFRTDRFELMGLETFWLSPTPDEPGSRFEKQSGCPRLCTRATLRPLGTPRIFHAVNTHLDHEYEEARVQGARLIMARLKELLARRPAPLFLTGDMNDYPDSAALKAFTEDEGLSLTDQTPGFKASYHGWGKCPDAGQIDYILTSGLRAVKPPVAWTERPYGKYLSDHNALGAFLDFEA